MREEEKIFAGKLFDARTKELRDIKHKDVYKRQIMRGKI